MRPADLIPGGRWGLRLQGWTSVALLLGCVALAAWLSTRYQASWDLTAAGRHTLSEASRGVLDALEGPVRVTAYAREEGELRRRIRELVRRYQRHDAELRLEFVDPDAFPDLVREMGISRNGELVVHYRDRSEHVSEHTEQALSNALQTLARGEARWLAFLAGHGERDPLGQANHDLGQWGRQLENRGYKVQTLNLASTGAVPDNASVLVVASPEVALLPGEAEVVREWVEGGGNLLWLDDPGGGARGLEPLARALGLERPPGTLVDPVTRLFGIDQPGFVLVTDYPEHPPVAGLRYATVFPQARVIRAGAPEGWSAQSILVTGEHAWRETGPLEGEGEVSYEEDSDAAGPHPLGVALTRARGEGEPEQRVIVIGDGDFLSNSYVGNSGNLDLGIRLMSWLAADDALLDIPARTAGDRTLELPRSYAFAVALGFLFGVPGVLLASGAVIWYRRRRY